MHSIMRCWWLMLLLLQGACAQRPNASPMTASVMTLPVASDVRITRHEGADDLLTAGLGIDGLRGALPAFDDPLAPSPAQLRRRAIWSNWRAIVDLTPTGGFGTFYGSTASVPGREYSALLRVPGVEVPHRVLTQVPDAFDRKARCLVVTPVSGSRGVYGAVGFSSSWALPRGCAVVYTDKGLGTDLYDFNSRSGVLLDGTRASAGELAFMPPGAAPRAPHRVAFRHAHSASNPEAEWGRHTLQALRFGLQALDLAFPELAPFTVDNTRIIGAALSNGGGALLRATELPGGEAFAAVVAAAPNLTAPRALHLSDYALQAALYQPCIFGDPEFVGAPSPLPLNTLRTMAARRCNSLARAGLLTASDPTAQAREALALLKASGWEDAPLNLAGFHAGLDLWRSVSAVYINAYARATADRPVCGYSFAMLDAQGAPRASTAQERASWWSDGSGIAPSTGVTLLDDNAKGEDPAFAGLDCVWRLRSGGSALSRTIRESMAATVSSATPRAGRVLVLHGVDDGLVPAAFASRAWIDAVRERAPQAQTYYWEIPNVQHFDAFLGLPSFAGRMLPLIPYAHQALDLAWAAVVHGKPMPAASTVNNRVPPSGQLLQASDLGRLSDNQP